MKSAAEAVSSAMDGVVKVHRDMCAKWREQLCAAIKDAPTGWDVCKGCGGKRDLDEGESAVAFRKGVGSILTLRPCNECEIRKRLVLRGVPAASAHCSFANWEERTSKSGPAREKAVAFAEGKAGIFLIRGATSGLGKTHLAIAIMRKVSGGFFMDHATIGREIRRGYAERLPWNEHPENKLVEVDGLVLDDLGFGSPSKDEKRIIQDALYARANAGKSKWTVITTNMVPAAMRKFLEPRVSRRILDQITDWVDLEPKKSESLR